MPIDLARLQATLRQRRARWTAQGTPQSLLSDQQKRALCGVIVDPADLAAIKASQRAEASEPHFDPEVDWRNRKGNHVSPVEDQEQCGSCVSFGCCALVTSMASIERESLLDLSEADLHFGPEHGVSCDGWWPTDALNVIEARGVVDEASFPYQSAFDNPPYPHYHEVPNREAHVTRIRETSALTEVIERKNYLTHVGPCVAVMEVFDDFYSYGGGVYHHVDGGSTGFHCIEVIGYSEADHCWICKNSWGPIWGDAGFFRIAYGECGIDTDFPFWTAKDVQGSVSQDILAQFGSNAIRGSAGYYVPNEGTQHVIVGTNDGRLTEVYWRSGQGVHQGRLATFSTGIVDVGGYFNSDEGTQHAIVGTRDGELIEVYWKSGQGVHQGVLARFGHGFLGIAGYYVPNEGTQHVIVGTNDGRLTEVYWRSGQGVHQVVLATFSTGIVDVGGYFNSDEGTQHAIVGTGDGTLIEVYWRSGQGVHQDVLTRLSRSITAVAGYYVPSEGTQHALVGTNDGMLTQVYWRSGQGIYQNTLATFPSGIADIGGYFNPDEGTQHAIAGIHDGSLVEVYW